MLGNCINTLAEVVSAFLRAQLLRQAHCFYKLPWGQCLEGVYGNAQRSK